MINLNMLLIVKMYRKIERDSIDSVIKMNFEGLGSRYGERTKKP